MNLVPCGRDEPIGVGGHVLALSPEAAAAAVDADEPVLGFRPESVAVGSGDIPAEIRVVEDLGSEVFVHVAVQHRGDVVSVVAKVPAPFAGRPGEPVQIGVRGAVHVFDASGPRLATSSSMALNVAG